MHRRYRSAFNATHDDARYARYVRRLEERVGPVGFRLAETPVFFEAALVERCEREAREIVTQLCDPARAERLQTAVPQAFAGDDRSALPQFAVVDFAIAALPDGTLVPRVVELQGFPSLYAFEAFQRDAWTDELEGCDARAAGCAWFSHMDRTAYVERLRRTILGTCEPECVVLLDLEPEKQKTACDFLATRTLCDVEAADPRALVRRGKRLYRRDAAGRERPVKRIYNRLVGDDLSTVAETLAFDVRDDLELEWAAHPRWFWQWSKASLPALDHPAVPRTRLLSEIDALPDDLSEAYVLKPLFSFAGGGVDVRPTAAACAAIPLHERAGWCLQEKIEYAGAVTTPEGEYVKVELRVMFLRPDDEAELLPATNLARLSRGLMHGVDHNRDRTWVGSSIGLWEGPEAR